MKLAATALVLTVSLASGAEPFLSPVFTDNMVLQRDQKDAVWGWSKPGDQVTVSIAGQSATSSAGADGKWSVLLPPLPAGGPHTLTVSGPENVTLNNVLVGDVWICSGQSNMEWRVNDTNNAQAEIAAANFPQIRHIEIPHVTAAEPQKTVATDGWKVASPETVSRFTAVGFYFGRKLNEDLKVPIGLIHTSWGGTIAEAWTSKEALTPMNDFNQAMADLERRTKTPEPDPQIAWYAANDEGSKGGSFPWAATDFDDSGWSTMNQPQEWTASNIPDVTALDGSVWLRRSVDLPADFAGKEAVLSLGPIDDEDAAWVNGQKIGETAGFATPREYTVPTGLLKEGKNVIAVRVMDASGKGGLTGTAETVKLESKGLNPIPLAGPWHYKVGSDLTKTSAFPRRMGDNPNVPTVLYNAMIAPLLPYGIKGAIWYQGESNAGRAAQYRKLLPTMIGDWRQRFGQGEFPFYIVQLANFMQAKPEPGESEWAELREAQAMTAKKLPNSGLAVAIDIGEANDIHPRNKQDVGKRLALQALAKTYGQKVVPSGPEFREAKTEGGTIRLSFDYAGGGLVVKGGGLKGFSIAGADKKFVWADAKIDGGTVVVSSPQVPAPAAVRYAWTENPDATLFNAEGLPAIPFRTDTWPGVTEGRK
ncbi:sialate O-acetylesterase [Luteolibacter luteus]|uniref:9-O-acetylesterase n=1 Tax=Luteolibacter luteus TaxID=2728835 RepID=A0A858RFH2_9BACT|nr:sialate O-acetylesterase [Luteolibacter luteus]QJE95465.1 9-O-acetylesterase [Luteolibacter luteus]